MCEIAIGGSYPASDNHFDHRFATRVLRKITVMAYNDYDERNRICFRHQPQSGDSVGGKDMPLAPGSAPIPLPHSRSTLFIEHRGADVLEIFAESSERDLRVAPLGTRAALARDEQCQSMFARLLPQSLHRE